MSHLTNLTPYLRIPLIINNCVSIGLTFPAAFHWSFNSWNSSDRDMPLGLGVTLILSSVFTFICALKHFVQTRPRACRHKAPSSDGRKLCRYGTIGAIDLAFAITLLVLHILNVVVSGQNGHPTILMMYAAFGALVASNIHLLLFLSSVHAWFKHWASSRPRCPTCSQRVIPKHEPIYVAINTKTPHASCHDEECPKYDVTMHSEVDLEDADNVSISDEGAILLTPDDEA